ncbi:DUF2383 domain-containing protein [Metabacillus sp. BG109]|uniref:DUF2383 domain-containing protein n=2 Tax=Metabacillus bambusae TaxID=2795218 RepID=A0ABS3N2F8_9BACI|nr:DUF2383 domain-containing protein [Metabacillus bambusae]
MGIRPLEHYIKKVNNSELKNNFQSMQQDIKQNAQKVAERIQNLGRVPADDEAVSGSMHSFMHKIMLPIDSKKIIEDALKGMDNYGVQYSEEFVKGDLDQTSKQIVEEVIDTSRRHVEYLRHLLH